MESAAQEHCWKRCMGAISNFDDDGLLSFAKKLMNAIDGGPKPPQEIMDAVYLLAATALGEVRNRRIAEKIGPTGEAPITRNPSDRGGLRAALSIQDGVIRMDFGTLLSFVAMTAEEARGFAKVLQDQADKLQGGK